MFGRSARGFGSSFCRISSSSNFLRNAAKAGKSGSKNVRKVSVLSTVVQSKLFKGTSSNNQSFVSIQEKYGKALGKNIGSISTTCDTPQILVQLLTESGIGTELQEDDDEMSSVSGKEKHRRKQKY